MMVSEKRPCTTVRRFKVSKLLRQKLLGVLVLLVSVVFAWMVASGSTPEECDGTALVFSVPFGFYLLFSRHIVIS